MRKQYLQRKRKIKVILLKYFIFIPLYSTILINKIMNTTGNLKIEQAQRK